MALLPFFRSILKRLKSLTRPVPLVSGVVLTILAIFIWDYVRHPEWFGTYSQEGDGPNESIDLSGLTPEEQAAVADIDNLAVLFNDLGIAPQGDPTIQATPQGGEDGSQDSLFDDILATPTPTETEPLANNSNPFDRYLNQYRFIGQMPQDTANGSLPNATQTGVNAATPGPLPTVSVPSLRLSLQNGSNAILAPSPLERALQEQAASSSASEGSSSLSTLESEGRSPENTNQSVPTSENGDALSTLEGQNSRTVTIPGVPFPVAPTTPEMSPPPGTTGYTPPASLQYAQPTTGTSNSGFPTNGAVPSSPNSAGIPNIPSGSGVPNLAAPQVDVSNGASTPSLPSSTVSPATPEVTPSPFSVPRPPGSYIGGGYVGPTFSNPSGPPR